MTQQDREILQLAQRIQRLSVQTYSTSPLQQEEDMSYKLRKISELVNALLPRIEERVAVH